MKIKCSNGRTLLIMDLKNVSSLCDIKLIPAVVLLTAWSQDDVVTLLRSGIIASLLNKGTRNFVCLGGLSEQLHDEIDDFIFRFDDDNEKNFSSFVITTYHNDESIQDSVAYYVFGTELSNKTNECLLAVLNEENIKDNEIKNAIMCI